MLSVSLNKTFPSFLPVSVIKMSHLHVSRFQQDDHPATAESAVVGFPHDMKGEGNRPVVQNSAQLLSLLMYNCHFNTNMLGLNT